MSSPCIVDPMAIVSSFLIIVHSFVFVIPSVTGLPIEISPLQWGRCYLYKYIMFVCKFVLSISGLTESVITIIVTVSEGVIIHLDQQHAKYLG